MPFDTVQGATGGPNLTYGLVETVGRAIVAGEYRGAPFPTEGVLEMRHGVSRSVIREAVKMLTAKGLLGSRPKHGTYVLPEQEWNLFDADILRWTLERPTSLDLLLHFNELRLGVEPQAAALAAQRSSEDQRIDIDAAIDRSVQAEAGIRMMPQSAAIRAISTVRLGFGAPSRRILRRMDTGKDHAKDYREAGRLDADHRRRQRRHALRHVQRLCCLPRSRRERHQWHQRRHHRRW